jgi:hypothetical protein
MKYLRTAAVVIGLAAYVVAFYATPLPSVRSNTGQPLLRVELVRQLLLLPDELLLPNWFGTLPEVSLLDRLPVLLIAGAILAWATALGWLLVRVICTGANATPAPQLTRLEVFVFSVAVGLGTISTWVLLMGLFGVMNRLWVFVAPALLTLAAAGYLWHRNRISRGPKPTGCNPWASDRASDGKPIENGPALRLGPHWLWLATPFVVTILLAAMLPPLDFDVREYHLQAPKEFFQQGQITFLPHNVYANMALGTEMLSLLAMIVSGHWWLGALAGKTVIAAFTPLTALALLAAGRRLFTPSAGVVAALVYLSVPWVVSIATGGFVEGASACYLFLAVYALLLRDPLGTRSFALAGYLAGAAVATKYPAALFVLLPLAGWVLLSNLRPWPRAFVPLGVFLLAAALACGLWFGKNWALTGNPTYPLLYGVFDGQTWNAQKEQQWNRVHRPHDFSVATLGKDLGRVTLTSEWLSPLVVPLAALALLSRGRRSRIAWGLLAYVGFVLAVWWLFTHRIDRFWIPVLPVAALLAGAGACWTADRWWRILLLGLLLGGLGANFLVASADRGNAWFIGLARLRHDLAWIDPWHEYFNTHETQGRLLTVGEAAVFDLKRPVLYNTCFDDCIFEQLVQGKTAAKVRAELAARQITYVYVNWGEIARYRATYGFTDFVQPEVFARLVAEGVLEPLPPIKGHWGRGYRVRSRQ